jgi:multiple sugar transport system substrate-binding protein
MSKLSRCLKDAVWHPRLVKVAAIIWASYIVGCTPPSTAPVEAGLPLRGIALKLLVVDDEPLAKAIALLRGQWQAETGSELSVDTASQADLIAWASGGEFSADAVIYTPRMLGTLVESKAISAIARESLAAREIDWGDIFELLKTREVTWGDEVYAIPLGSPVFVCFYREDLFESLGLKPPRTWEEYHEIVAVLAKQEIPVTTSNEPSTDPDAKADAWSATVEPLGTGWAGLTLLAHASAYARHPNHYSTLFNMQTMEPLLASPPFVRALQELVVLAKLLPLTTIEYDPADAWRALLAGRSGMALCWPAVIHSSARDADAPQIGCVELPGSPDVYNATAMKWERRADGAARVPLVGITGRVGSVSTKSTQQAAALQLLAWLASRKWSERIDTASTATTLFRTSQVATAEAWSRGLRAPEAKRYASAVAASLAAPECLIVPRIAGADRYLAALDGAVRQALTGQQTPEAALVKAADEWRGITAELGLDRQRDAYQRSLGLE